MNRRSRFSFANTVCLIPGSTSDPRVDCQRTVNLMVPSRVGCKRPQWLTASRTEVVCYRSAGFHFHTYSERSHGAKLYTRELGRSVLYWCVCLPKCFSRGHNEYKKWCFTVWGSLGSFNVYLVARVEHWMALGSEWILICDGSTCGIREEPERSNWIVLGSDRSVG